MYKKNNTLLLYSIIYFAFLYIPVMLLPIFSFNDAIHMVFPLKGFTFKWYDQMINASRLHQALFNSIKVGVTIEWVNVGLCGCNIQIQKNCNIIFSMQL